METGGFESPDNNTEGNEVGMRRGKGRAMYNYKAAPEQTDAHAARCGCRMVWAYVYIGLGHRAMGGLELGCLALGVSPGRGPFGAGHVAELERRNA